MESTIIFESRDHSFAISMERMEGGLILRSESITDTLDTAARIKPIDVSRDIIYTTPRMLSGSELAEELDIHVPPTFRAVVDGATVISSYGRSVLIQWVDRGPRLSPLSAIARILSTLDHDAALLICEGEGVLVARRNTGELSLVGQPIALEDFASLTGDQRQHMFNLHSCSEVVIAGSALTPELLEVLNASASSLYRRFDETDLMQLAGDDMAIEAEFGGLEHVYALAIAAAMANLDVLETVPSRD